MSGQYLDPSTKKIIYHYNDKSVFTVYVRHRNGPRRVVFSGSGYDVEKVLEVYNFYKLTPGDFKYLYHRLVDEKLDEEVRLLSKSAPEGTRKHMEGIIVGRKKIQYQSKSLPPINSVPISLMTEFNHILSKPLSINKVTLSKTRCIAILMAHLVSLNEVDRIKLLTEADLKLEKHKLGSGGTTEARVEKVWANEEDLL